jgi:predicted nucleotidyltransferase
MGRVYTPEEVADGAIPKRGAHELAGREILRDIEAYGETHGALIYGSTADGRATMRSDLDVFVSFPSLDSDKTLVELQGIFAAIEAKYKVFVEPHALDSDSLSNPLRHSIDPLFAEELQRSALAFHHQRWVTGWPIRDLRTFEATPRRIRSVAMQYSSSKAKQFGRAILSYRGQLDTTTLQRALELPAAVGRKVIPATAVIGEYELDTTDKRDMTRETQRRLKILSGVAMGTFRDEFNGGWLGSADPVGTFEALARLNHEYSTVLFEAYHGGISVDTYREWLDKNYLRAIQLARTTAFDWSEIMNKLPHLDFNPDSTEYELSPDYDHYVPDDEPFDDNFDELPPEEWY